jgi:phage terminase small subunit
VTVDTYVEGRGEGAHEVKRVRFKLCDKLGALRDLGRHHKLFTDKVEHEAGKSLEELLAMYYNGEAQK